MLIAVWWQKTSSPPPSCVMNPNPFASLNHFTVPVAISAFVLVSVASPGMGAGKNLAQSPTAAQAAVLLLEPLLQRLEVFEDRRGIHLALSGHGVERLLPRA